jgi:hypothetical protein
MRSFDSWLTITPRLDDEQRDDWQRRAYTEWRQAALEEAERQVDFEYRGDEEAIRILIQVLKESPR